ncbi:MAG: hypothetical protein QOC81_654 [Thermoanaerobaculia bacterium]|nr:hypothetical protein [Thermoanaerobaculia bacterium]
MHHFIDEAGDLSLFNKRKQVVLGTDGVSNYFMVGAAFVAEPEALEHQLASLRENILQDPLLNRIPSLDPARRKTAISFHAKDDAPEVRYKVFGILAGLDVQVFVAIRDKRFLAEDGRRLFRREIRLSQNEIYDDLVSRILRNRLHLADSNTIIVARRGTRDRKEALTAAIGLAQANFAAKWGTRNFGPCDVATAYPHESGGLQVADYFLWALQRLYERREDRYFVPLAAHYRIIMDLDDTRRKAYGEWYSSSNPLSLEN